ncbi:MAG: efflux RND transporter permease subunit [Halobacteriovoraceae bacterium]|nr:efflux RND transporter permease subunit [Halobacteriovoraceae bacterium]
MNKLIRYFVDKSVLVNLISLLILVSGIISIFTLQKETFPNVSFDRIIIRTTYPGSTAEDVEKLVSIPMEREIQDISGIEEMNAMSGEGFSIVDLQIDPEYDIDKVLQDVRSGVDQVDLPDEAENPSIYKAENKNRPIIKIGVFGTDETSRRFHGRRLRDLLEQNPSVAKVNIDGERDLAFIIEVDPKKLETYDMSLQEVATVIRDRNINLSAGAIETSEGNIMVRTQNEFEKPEDIEKIVIRSNTSGNFVRVKDVAQVKLGFEDLSYTEKVMGEDAVVLDVLSQERADVLKLTDDVKEITETYMKKHKDEGLRFRYVDEYAFFVKRRLGVLTNSATMGMILVFSCLLLFMNFRVSFITSLGAPLAFLVAFMFMDYAGMSVNLISMFGLILVLGMLVDDSIIVAENFYQHLERGMDPKKAAIISSEETIAPVTATVLTTMIAFGCLFFMGGIMGKFLWPVPAVVIICLTASWLECFFILPSHLADFVRINPKGMEKTRWYQPLLNHYKRMLHLCLSRKYLTIFSFIALFLGSVVTAKMMKFELFPDDDVTVLFYKVKGKVGTPFEETAKAISIAEQAILKSVKENELDALRSIVGNQYSRGGTPKVGDQYGMIIIYLKDDSERDRGVDEIINSINKEANGLLPDYEVSLDRAQNGPPRGKPVNIEISGESLKDLEQAAHEIDESLSQFEGVSLTEIDYEEGKKQLLIDVKEDEARRLGLTNYDIAIEARRSFEGQIVAEIRKSDEDVDVIVRLNKEARSQRETLENLYISNKLGRRIKLSQVADIKEQKGAYVIRRFERKRTISISAEIDKVHTTALKVNENVKKFMDKFLEKYPEITYQLTGENKDTTESVGRLAKAGIIALFLIFIILVAMFGSLLQPLIIMSSIPFGMIGVVAIFLIMGLPIGFMALMGIIGLIGVVVNDSIVLVSFINKKITEAQDLKSAIIGACLSRFRPVILTTFTTVAGLLPIAHMPGGDPFLKPMAISFAYGLLFSTTITLLFVPASYYVYALFLQKRALKKQAV